MRSAIFVVAVLSCSAAQAQSAPCFWTGQLFTCNQPSQALANADVFVAQAVTGPASAFTPDVSSGGLEAYSRGVHDSMVSKNPERLTSEAVSVSTEVIPIGSHEVLETRISASSQMFMYQFAGVSGADMVVVGCISRTARPFEIRGTECERQVAKTFSH
jgi:hypothetical protein